MNSAIHDFVPFLIYRVIAKGAQLAGSDYARLKLTIRQARILIVLLHNEGVGVVELSQLVDIEQSAMSHMLRKMEKANLVYRERREADNRSVHVRLSEDGRRVARKCFELSLKHSSRLMEGIDEADAEVLRRVLRTMYANAERWQTEHSSRPSLAPDRRVASE